MQNKHHEAVSDERSYKHIYAWSTLHKDPMGNVLACASSLG